jgi:phage FluMu protein Com
VDVSIACADCGLVMEDASGSCPECGSRNRHILTAEQITLVTTSARARKRDAPQARPHEEVRDEIRWSGDRNRLERRIMVINRRDDRYSQEWSDLQTGEVTYSKSGRLGDPDMHGQSARRPKSP